MACGTPAITTDATGVSSLIGDDDENLITSINNPISLAEQLEYLIHNEEARNLIESRVEYMVKEQTWEKTAKEIIRVALNMEH